MDISKEIFDDAPYFSRLNHCCDVPNIEYKDGFAVCFNCGMVVDKIYVGQERRAYNRDESNDRICNEPKWREFGPRTVIPSNKKDFKGVTVSSSNRLLYSRLSKIQRSLTTGYERNLWEAKPKLKYLAVKLSIPNYIKYTAWKIYLSVAGKKLTIGRSIEGFVAASLYAAIRIHTFPKLLDDISEHVSIPRRTVIRSLSLIIKEILPDLNLKYSPITAQQLVYYFGNSLKLPMKVQKEAIDLLSRAINKGLDLNGKDPKGFAAAVIYLAAKASPFGKTQDEVAKSAKTTEQTIRSRIKDLKKNIFLPNYHICLEDNLSNI